MFETLAIFSCSLQCSFFSFFFFSDPEKSRLACGRIYFYEQHAVATTEGHEVTPFLISGFFFTSGQNKNNGSKKLLMAKKARIRAYPEEEATRTAMANRLGYQGHLGHQKLTKENLAGQSFFAQEDH
jgi:hypothetical protein